MSGAGMAGVTYFASNKDDPYITLADPVSQNSITGALFFLRGVNVWGRNGWCNILCLKQG